MFLKNYTSDVPVAQTIYKIEQVLIWCGVAGIAKDYAADGAVNAISFKLPAQDNNLVFRIPVNEARAIEALWLDYVDGDKLTADGAKIEGWSSRKKKTKADFVEQGRRTAWKIMQDWVEVQMSLIQLKQADTMEVFLPYVWNGKQTYYQSLKENNFRAMLPEKAGA